MQGFNMGRYVPPETLDPSLAVDKNTITKGKKREGRNNNHHHHSSSSQTVRFECPFAIWCTTCSPPQLIGQGVRFNASKTRVGNYYSTPIWRFGIKHTVCGGAIEVRTDPQNAEYVVGEGGRKARKEMGEAERLEGGEGEIDVKVKIKGGSGSGGFGTVEKKVLDRQQLLGQGRRLEDLEASSRRDWDDPYERSRVLRREFRVGRRLRKEGEESGQRLKERFGLAVDILPETKQDAIRAKLVQFGPAQDEDRRRTEKPLFEITTTAATTTTATTNTTNGDDNKKPSSDRSDISTKTSRRTGATKTANTTVTATAPQKKLSLARELQGNTRIAIDPFLAESGQRQSAWTPATGPRKKRKAENVVEVDGGKQKEGEREREREPVTGSRLRLEQKQKLLVEYESDSLYSCLFSLFLPFLSRSTFFEILQRNEDTSMSLSLVL